LLVLRYAPALLLLVASAGLAALLPQSFAPVVPFLFLLPVIIGAWYGGTGPGLLVSGLGGLVLLLLAFEPLSSPTLPDPARLPGIIMFVCVSSLVSWVMGATHSVGRREQVVAQELAKSKELNRQLLETAQEGVWILDEKGQTSYISKRMARMLAYEVEEIIGRPFWEFLETDSRKEAEQMWQRRKEGGTAQRDLRFRRSDGSELYALVAANPKHDARGEFVGGLVLVTDFTRSRRAEKTMRFIVDAGQVLAASLDYESTLHSLARLTVPSLADWCTVDMLEEDGSLRRLAIIHTDPEREKMACEVWRGHRPDPAQSSGLLKALQTGKPEIYEDLENAGSEGPVSDTKHLRVLRSLGLNSAMIVPLRARGQTFGAITLVSGESGRRYGPAELSLAEGLARRAALAFDNALLYREAQKEIAERKQAETALRQSTENLKQIEAELRRTNQAKDAFLAMLAHELRNPLAPLVHALHFLRIHGPRNGDLEQARAMAERQARHLTRLVDDLLDVSRITHGKIELRKEPVEISTLVSRALEASRGLLEERAHHLTVAVPEEPIFVDVDVTRMEQVIVNLLDNAAKFTERGGQIQLRVERCGNEAVIRLHDSGIGIPAELLPHVFDLFVQADSSLDRSQGGLGIGLTLARTLVDLHGGNVQAISEGPGKGSEFVIRFPVASTSPATQVVVQPSGSNGEPLRILVVDDNIDAVRSLAMVLEAFGHAVHTAHDGPAALEAAASFRPEAILLDIGLPRMDGYEVARRLRQAGQDKALLVALTGYGQEEDRRRSREAGFDLHLVKPVDPQELEEILCRGKIADYRLQS
jgi:PAS domain S-box-containing protein